MDFSAIVHVAGFGIHMTDAINTAPGQFVVIFSSEIRNVDACGANGLVVIISPKISTLRS